MSRIGRLPITVPAGVEVKVDGNVVSVKGAKGELSHTLASPITASLEETPSPSAARTTSANPGPCMA